MERFLKFKENVTLKSLSEKFSDDRIIVLRESKTTGTIQVQILEKMSSRQIKEAFKPLTVEKVYKEFPYPITGDKFWILPRLKLKSLF